MVSSLPVSSSSAYLYCAAHLLLRSAPCRLPSFAPIHPGSSMVFRSVFKAWFTLLCQFHPPMLQFTVFSNLPSSCRYPPRPDLPTTRWRMRSSRHASTYVVCEALFLPLCTGLLATPQGCCHNLGATVTCGVATMALLPCTTLGLIERHYCYVLQCGCHHWACEALHLR